MPNKNSGNLEDAVRKLAEQVNQQSDNPEDAPKREALLKKLQDLQQKIDTETKKKKAKRVCYFSKEEDIPKGLYEMVSCIDITFEMSYLKAQLGKSDTSTPFYCKWGAKYYQAKALDSHLESIRNEIRLRSKKAAEDAGFDAVYVDEQKAKIIFSISSKKWDLHTYGNVAYSVSAIAKLYNLKKK